MRSYNVVMAKRTEFNGALGKRVKALPTYFAFEAYSVEEVRAGSPFIGYTYAALQRGARGRHYGAPVAVCDSLLAAKRVADQLNKLVDAIKWYMLEPKQLGYDPDVLRWPQGPAAEAEPPHGGFGNLVWALVKGMLTRSNSLSWVLLDLEDIRKSRFGDKYVAIVHKHDVDSYGNSGVYTDDIEYVDVTRAGEVLFE